MKVFRCDQCNHPVFFENVTCLHCGSALAFLPDRLALYAVDETEKGSGLWQRKGATAQRYRLCRNHEQHQACNFAVGEQDPSPWCVSCRRTRILPDLSVPGNPERWYRVEVAKRRLYYTLAKLRLVDPRQPDGEAGPAYEFLADVPGQAPVMTGHSAGIITLNIAEADDDERTRRRMALHEPYRTLLGHLRHESGHYYWDLLIRGEAREDAFRALFGDERADYAQALQAHYARGGGVADWPQQHVSAYATAHPWEDWAETWAHYLHMVDLLETAAAYQTRVDVPGAGSTAEQFDNPFSGAADFDELVEQWVPLTLMLNSLNRSLGQNDAYPFALAPGALAKLRYVHDVIRSPRVAQPAAQASARASASEGMPSDAAPAQNTGPEGVSGATAGMPDRPATGP